MTFRAKHTTDTFSNVEERVSEIVDVPVQNPNDRTLISYKKIVKA